MPGPSARRPKGKTISTASDSDSGYSESESEDRNLMHCIAVRACRASCLGRGVFSPVLGNNRPACQTLHIFTPFSQQKKTLHQKKKKRTKGKWKTEKPPNPTLKLFVEHTKKF